MHKRLDTKKMMQLYLCMYMQFIKNKFDSLNSIIRNVS